MAVLNYSQVMKKYGTKNYSELRKKMQAEGEAPEWFTTGGAQLFFEKYSWEGETVKSRLKSIAKDLARKAPTTYPTWWNVDAYCAGKTWEDVFFQVMWDGFISCSTPLLANGGLPERGTTVSCLTGDALINTKHGGLKRMEDIEIGDEVLTHKGRWKKVINKMSRMSDGDLYQLKVRTRTTKTKITGNHPVLTQEGWVNVEDLTPQHLIAVNKELTEVVEQDFTMSFDNSVLVKPSVGKLVNDVVVDGDLAWALGLWFAEGSLNRISDGNGNTHGRAVRVTMATHEECHVQRFLQIMKDKLGVDGNYYHSEFEGRTWVSGQVSSKVVAEYFGKNFGTGCKTKVVPRWVIDLPKEKLQQFLNGFYCGDGRKPNGTKYSTPDIRIHNQQLLAQLYEISAKLGYTTSLMFDNNEVGTPKGSLVFSGCSDFGFPEKVRVRKYPSDGINLFQKFDLEKLDKDELVYDITVEDDHSFSVAGVVVHNCAGGYVGDDLYSRYDVVTESAILTKHSHGTSCSVDDWAYKGKPLPRGGFAGGVMPLIRDLITCMDEVVQGSRRGSLSYALSIEHPEWYDVLNYLYKNPESNNPAWLVKDEFINKLESLVPQDYVDALSRLGKAVEVKMMRGKGYFTKIDEMNRHLAQAFKDAGMTVKASNLCQETNLAADEDHTFSCVILNWNLDHYRETMAKCPHIGFIAHVMQDCNVSVYIEAIKKRKLEGKRDAKALEKILRFTEKFRAVGTGVLGLHTLFQKESVVVGSIESFQLNNKIFKYLDQETLAASQWLAQELGCPEGTKHLGIRNATRMMMPPTKSTAEFMAGASEGIGLDVAMVYTKQSAGGELVRVNKVLLPIMKERGVFNETTLMDLSMKKGSVQHVDWLTDHEKAVFRTAFEIDMEAHLKLCSQRQQYIDQGQSINLYFTSNDSHEYIMDIHRKALLDPNILTLYYVYSMRGSGEISRDIGCSVCQ